RRLRRAGRGARRAETVAADLLCSPPVHPVQPDEDPTGDGKSGDDHERHVQPWVSPSAAPCGDGGVYLIILCGHASPYLAVDATAQVNVMMSTTSPRSRSKRIRARSYGVHCLRMVR